MSKLSINVVSESAFTVQGHGVHTAFEEHVRALKKYTDYEVLINSSEPTDIVHAHTVGPYSWTRLRHARYGRVYSAHVTAESFIGSLRGAKLWYPISKAYLKFVYRRTNHIVAVSPKVKQELIAMSVGRPITVIPNMIELTNFPKISESQKTAFRKKYKLPKNKKIVICSGQVQPRKGIQDWIKVADKMPDVHFLWIGGVPFGAVADKSKDMAELMNNKPDNATFTGVIKLAEARQLYQLGDVFWLPSYQETFGLVVIEAAACGLPIVLRDIAVYRDIFKDQYLKARSNQAFIEHLNLLLSQPATYKSWQAKALNLAKQYSSQLLIKDYQKLYSSLVNEKLNQKAAE